MAETAQI